MDVVSGAQGVVECPNCGELSEARFRLCGFCGHALAADRPLDEVSRYVTIVTSDSPKGGPAVARR